MELRPVDEDRKIAQAICDDIHNGDNTSLNHWFSSHYSTMYRFIQFRNRDNAEDILHKFYIELCSGNAFCKYGGVHNCSLKSYIMGRLKFRSLPEKLLPDSELPVEEGDSDGDEDGADKGNRDDAKPKNTSKISIMNIEDISRIGDTQESMEECLLKAQSGKIINQIFLEALERLSNQQHKAEDAMLIRWYLDEFTYEDMAKQLLMHKNIHPTGDTLNRECARIRKRFTRPGGTLSRFEVEVKQLMYERGFTEADLSLE